MDLTPIRRSRALALVLAARILSLLCIGLTSVGVVVQVYGQSRSSTQVAAVSLVLGTGLLAGLLVGGILADRQNRKRLIMVGSCWAVVTFAALSFNAASDHPQLWVIYLLGGLFGLTEGVAETAMTAVVPSLVSEELLPATGALITVTTTIGAIAGPVLGGLLIAGPGLATTFAVAAAGTAVTMLCLAGLGPMPPEGADEEQPGPLDALREGFAFVRGSRIVGAVLVVDLCAALFATPAALFPQLAEQRFGGGPELVGILTTAPMVGATLASVTSGWTGRLGSPGRVLFAAVAAFGLACMAFGLSPLLGFGLFFLALGGMADTISEILRRTLLMQHTPDRLQGRVGSLWLAQAMTAPALGGVLAGLGASFLGPATTVAVGGAVCVVGAGLVALFYPELWRLDAQLKTSDGASAAEAGAAG
ncbi:enterobactin transporter EntS [Streptomyces sp. AP-93]|uniref:enterobactin transporter EntS n=1 Tax=Streptomyces sp. AP-93 TaxID=2929048 RepID=UPI001FAEEA95|nr:enterobactin transporter EntS [Streptomyces sp. AP-93]MCJ0874456.1 enterobactin transporter EntS [Streptomyces sp. AP-93]